jgi:competence protein ComEC
MWLGQNPYTPEYVRLLKKAISKAVILRDHGSGDQLLFHGSQMIFLNPGKDHNLSSLPSNNDSLAFQLRFGARTFLLTGDIERKIENQVMGSNVSIDSNVLKVAHHGSRSLTTEEFLARVNPLLAVISVAEHSPFGHPHLEVLKRLRRKSIEVFRTDQNGAITISTDGNQLRVNTFLD